MRKKKKKRKKKQPQTHDHLPRTVGLTVIKHEMAAMMRVIASQLTSSKMAENLISCRSHSVDIQKLIPSTIPIKTSITIYFLSPQTHPHPLLLLQHIYTPPIQKLLTTQTAMHVYIHIFSAVFCEKLKRKQPIVFFELLPGCFLLISCFYSVGPTRLTSPPLIH